MFIWKKILKSKNVYVFHVPENMLVGMNVELFLKLAANIYRTSFPCPSFPNIPLELRFLVSFPISYAANI